MSCLKPLTLYHSEPTYVRRFRKFFHLEKKYTFTSQKGYNPFSIPCGQCLGCRIDHSRDWALRCMHHSKQYEKNCFITLTFDDHHLKDRKSVEVAHFQKFMKRFRRKLEREGRDNVEYFHSTEYGENKKRPHHHAIIFNYFPPDAYEWKNVGGNIYYRSAELEELWHHQGFIVVGSLSYQTAAYTASYTFKKMKTKEYEDGVAPEKMTCSQGIGIDHFLTYYKDYCALGHIIHDGKRHRIPRAYLKKLKDHDPQVYDSLKVERELKAREDSILDRFTKYRYLVQNQERYKKKLCEDTPLSEDNRYLKQLKSLEIEIFRISGEWNPDKQERLYEDFRRL